jgi:hypothetical protein
MGVPPKARDTCHGRLTKNQECHFFEYGFCFILLVPEKAVLPENTLRTP